MEIWSVADLAYDYQLTLNYSTINQKRSECQRLRSRFQSDHDMDVPYVVAETKFCTNYLCLTEGRTGDDNPGWYLR